MSFMKSYTSKTDVYNQEDEESTPLNNHYEQTTSSNSWGCFKIFCFGRRQPQNQEENQETWLVKKLKSLKETSEVVAGHRWKNLLRKMGKYFRPKKPRCQFQYDQESYQSNFDHGIGDEEEEGTLHDFTSRFAPAQYK